MATVTDAPTTEAGYPGGLVPTYTGGRIGGAGSYLVEGLEANGDLRFPLSALVFDRMRREDGQVASVLRAITLPILGTGWRLDARGVRPEVARFVERELGLDVNPDDEAAVARRRREGIVWHDHLRHALLMLPFGFMPFEQVYSVGPAAPGLEDPDEPGRLYAHLRKLAPRMPRTLREVRAGRDGGLAGVVQEPPPGALGTELLDGVFIPVNRLVFYVNDREGADWTGTSVLRAAYKHWLIKDALIRLGAQIVERNGMGLPVVEYDETTTSKEEALALARAFRAGAESGAAVPKGKISVTLLGVTGSLVDELPRVKYHDEAIGRSLLAMFLNLGHDNGARALGDTFVDYFLMSLKAVVRNVIETATDHVIRDLVELNYGPEEPYPTLAVDELTATSAPTSAALKELREAGLLTPDPVLEADVRRRFGLPAAPPRPDDEQDAAASPFTEVGLPALVAAGIISEDEARNLLGLKGAAPEKPAPPVPPPAVPGGLAVVPDPDVAVTAAAAADDAAYVAETDAIRARRETAEGRAPHAFRAAKWTHPNGHPRCALCGLEERVGGRCPGSAHDGGTTTQAGARSPVTFASSAEDALVERVAGLVERVAALTARGK